MPGIILDSGTKPCLFEHLNIKIRPLCDTLCLQQFIIPLKLFHPFFQLFLNICHSTLNVLAVNNIVRSRKDCNMLQFILNFASQNINL